jgi:uncharacterized protein (DUF4415 family)
MEKKRSGSYQREKRNVSKGKLTKPLVDSEDEELAALVALRDEDIDTSDIPEVRDWSKAVVGKFYRPIKEPVTIRIDCDVLSWVKSEGPGYQTRINNLLREAMTDRSQTETHRHDGLDASPENAPREFCFPSLEARGELERYDRVAKLVETRHSLLARAS